MKIRHGFVSNSSSSSFVVAFPEMPKSSEHVKEMMFPNKETWMHPYTDDMYSTDEIANAVYHDICQQKENDKKTIIEGFEGWLEGAPEMDYRKDITNEDWDKYWRECDDYRNKVAKEFMKENKDKFIYTFEYSDGDGSFGSMMEHSGIFYNVIHKQISRH